VCIGLSTSERRCLLREENVPAKAQPWKSCFRKKEEDEESEKMDDAIAEEKWTFLPAFILILFPIKN